MSAIFKMYKIQHQRDIFVGLEDQKHFINEYQEYCDVIQKLLHAGKWMLATVRINLART